MTIKKPPEKLVFIEYFILIYRRIHLLFIIFPVFRFHTMRFIIGRINRIVGVLGKLFHFLPQRLHIFSSASSLPSSRWLDYYGPAFMTSFYCRQYDDDLVAPGIIPLAAGIFCRNPAPIEMGECDDGIALDRLLVYLFISFHQR